MVFPIQQNELDVLDVLGDWKCICGVSINRFVVDCIWFVFKFPLILRLFLIVVIDEITEEELRLLLINVLPWIYKELEGLLLNIPTFLLVYLLELEVLNHNEPAIYSKAPKNCILIEVVLVKLLIWRVVLILGCKIMGVVNS